MLSFAAPHQVMPLAKEAGLKALAIDDTVADAHVALAFALATYEWNWAGAEREFRRALDLNPGDTLARCLYAQLLCWMGRADGIAEARHAVELDPLSLFNRHLLANMLQVVRQFDAAMAEARAGIELEPTHTLYWDLAFALVGLDRQEEAVESLRHATMAAPGDPTSRACLGWALGLAGNRQEARAILEDLERRRTQDYCSGFVMALINVGLDEHEQALSWLEDGAGAGRRRSAKERDALLPFLDKWHGFDPLRAAPRFQALLRRMNFPCAGETGAVQ